MNFESDSKYTRGNSAVFESRECTAASYGGVNRRTLHRRSSDDRRVEMRFQADRRDSSGRRADDQKAKFW